MGKPILEQLKEIKSDLESMSLLELSNSIKKLNDCIDTLAMIEDILHNHMTSQDYIREFLKEERDGRG